MGSMEGFPKEMTSDRWAMTWRPGMLRSCCPGNGNSKCTISWDRCVGKARELREIPWGCRIMNFRGMMGDKRGGQQKQSPDQWVLYASEKGLHVILSVKRRNHWRILNHRGDSSHIRYEGSGVLGPSKYHYANITHVWAQLYWLNWLCPFM